MNSTFWNPQDNWARIKGIARFFIMGGLILQVVGAFIYVIGLLGMRKRLEIETGR